jgi:hypothetical protein
LEYGLSHVVVPAGKLRSFEGYEAGAETGVRISLAAPADGSGGAIIDASDNSEGLVTTVKFVRMSLMYEHIEGNSDYCFIKFSSLSGTVVMEDVVLCSRNPNEGKKHPGSVIKIMSGGGIFTRVSFRDIFMKEGSLIELEGGGLTVDSCIFSGVSSGEEGTADCGVIHAGMNE